MNELVYPVFYGSGKLYKIYVRHHAARAKAESLRGGTYKICKLLEV